MRGILSMVGEQTEKYSALRFFTLGAIIVLALTFAGSAGATILYSKIEKVPGFRFENFVYSWDRVALDVVNTASGNRQFGGTMIFLDRRGRLLASASLLPKKVAGLQTERYIAYFINGSGEAAQRARSVIWDFGAK